VRDPSGRAVVTAKVGLVNRGTDARRTTVTNDQGDFRFADIDVGTYVLVMEAPGFQREEFAQFDLLARESRRLDATLRVATQTQLVNVESSAGPAVQTDTSNVSETKTGRELVDLQSPLPPAPADPPVRSRRSLLNRGCKPIIRATSR
jgi:hypothetical protein